MLPSQSPLAIHAYLHLHGVVRILQRRCSSFAKTHCDSEHTIISNKAPLDVDSDIAFSGRKPTRQLIVFEAVRRKLPNATGNNMKNSGKFIRLALLSGFLGAALLGSAQPASAFSLNPVKAFKSAVKATVKVASGAAKAVGGAATTVAKGTAKVASGAAKVTVKAVKTTGKAAGTVGKFAVNTTGKAIKTTGKGVVVVGKGIGKGAVFVAKTGVKGAKVVASNRVVKQFGRTALLGTPLAPVIVAKQTVDSARKPPKLSNYIPAPPKLPGPPKLGAPPAPKLANIAPPPPKLATVTKQISTAKPPAPKPVIAAAKPAAAPKMAVVARPVMAAPKPLMSRVLSSGRR